MPNFKQKHERERGGERDPEIGERSPLRRVERNGVVMGDFKQENKVAAVERREETEEKKAAVMNNSQAQKLAPRTSAGFVILWAAVCCPILVSLSNYMSARKKYFLNYDVLCVIYIFLMYLYT